MKFTPSHLRYCVVLPGWEEREGEGNVEVGQIVREWRGASVFVCMQVWHVCAHVHTQSSTADDLPKR